MSGLRREGIEMTKEELAQYMTDNPDFSRYISEFCRAKHITVDKAFEMKIVENVALSYQNRLKGWTE